MNRRNTSLMVWMLGSMVLAGLTACSGSDDEPSKPDNDDVKVRRLTISQTEDAAEARALVGHASMRASNVADTTLGKATDRRVSGNGVAHYITRASLVEDNGLTASWTASDGLTYCNLSKTNQSTYKPYSGSLTAASTSSTSQFTGDVSCSAGDYLAVVYPATTFETNESYTLSLTGQDGTLATLAKNYHYVYGRAYVESVTDQTANATMPKMKSLLTVCKFSFIDKATGSAVPIQTLTISYGGSGSDAGKYPQTATVAIIDENNVILSQADVHAAGVAGNSPLLLEELRYASEVYVSLLPTAQRTYNFTVTNASGTYSGTANATLVEGEYVVATGLKLTKQ